MDVYDLYEKKLKNNDDLCRKINFQNYVNTIYGQEHAYYDSVYGLENNSYYNKPVANLPIRNYSSKDKPYTREFSTEAYFGKDNPLAKSLDNGVSVLKKLLQSPNDNKKQIIAHLKRWGREVGSILNCESFHFCLGHNNFTSESYASLYVGTDDAIELNKFTGEVTIDKIKYEQQHKMIETNNGYRFKSSKGKHLAVMISPYVFEQYAFNGKEERANNPRMVAGLICHEIGHAMEHCMLGALNDAYAFAIKFGIDKQFNEEDRLKKVILDKNTGKISVGTKKLLSLKNFSYINTMLNNSIAMNNLGEGTNKEENESVDQEMKKENNPIKDKFQDLLKLFELIPKSDLEKYKEKGLPLDQHPVIKAFLADKTIADSTTLLNYAKNYKNSEHTIDSFKHYSGFRKSKKYGKHDSGMFQYNLFDHEKDNKPVDVDVKVNALPPDQMDKIRKSIFEQIKELPKALPKLASKVFKYFKNAVREAAEKIVVEVVMNTLKNTALIVTGAYIRRARRRKRNHYKEEAFADIFASAHGYGDENSEMMTSTHASNQTTGFFTIDDEEKAKKRGYKKSTFDWMYNMPILNLLTYFNEYCFDSERHDPNNSYNTFGQRMNRTYLHLKHELNKCKDPKLRSELEKSLQKIKSDNNKLYNNKDTMRCRSYQLFDKIVRKSTFGKDSGIFANTDSKEVKKEVIEEYDKLEKVNINIPFKK